MRPWYTPCFPYCAWLHALDAAANIGIAVAPVIGEDATTIQHLYK